MVSEVSNVSDVCCRHFDYLCLQAELECDVSHLRKSCISVKRELKKCAVENNHPLCVA